MRSLPIHVHARYLLGGINSIYCDLRVQGMAQLGASNRRTGAIELTYWPKHDIGPIPLAVGAARPIPIGGHGRCAAGRSATQKTDQHFATQMFTGTVSDT